ncbi:MAG: hypothetical protein V4555_10905, partial [Acidobacteriota bacterium]
MLMNGFRRMRAAAAVVLMVVGVAAMKAQQEPYPEGGDPFPPAPARGGQTSTIHVKAQLVVLDIVVTDKKGNLVTRDLKRGDFTVYE